MDDAKGPYGTGHFPYGVGWIGNWAGFIVNFSADAFVSLGSKRPPGPLRRHLALAYCNLVQREHEYIALHRDTSAESDLKQRREIFNSADIEEARSGIVRPEGMGKLSAEWVDAAAVRAAIEGRILILEGIEKAERNVLPVLNNLLENREINLEDGRHLVHPSFYDRLLSLGNTQAQLDEWRLVRVHPQFRVIALGIPVPPYRGNPLDPPFRSRFQVRWIDGWGAVGRAGGRIGRGILVGERADEMDEDDVVGDFEKAKAEQERTGEMPQPQQPGGKNRGERVREMVRNVVMLAETVRVGNRMGGFCGVGRVVHLVLKADPTLFLFPTDDPSQQLSSTATPTSLLPAFPQPSIPAIVDLAQTFPDEFLSRKASESAVERVYPYASVVGGLTTEQKGAWANLLEKFGIKEPVPKAVVPKEKNPNTFYSDDDVPAPPPPPARRSKINPTNYVLDSVTKIEPQAANALVGHDEDDPSNFAQVLIKFHSTVDTNERVEMLVPSGPSKPFVSAINTVGPSGHGNGRIVQTGRFLSHLVPMLQHACMGQDLMVVGPRGSGKSTLVNLFSQALGYASGFTEKVDCYKDMTARDLLQRRGTRRGGSTYWWVGMVWELVNRYNRAVVHSPSNPPFHSQGKLGSRCRCPRRQALRARRRPQPRTWRARLDLSSRFGP